MLCTSVSSMPVIVADYQPFPLLGILRVRSGPRAILTGLDTREKIVPAQSVRAAGRVVLVLGYFDPLHAALAAKLRELRHDADTLIVAVDDPEEPLLPRQARAELVASLAGVDYVVVDPEARFPGARLHDLRSEHSVHRNQLSAYILRRHRGE
jgi:bifunctional ADP-heptose synthase (sugar kinase/adenylyltransferase)